MLQTSYHTQYSPTMGNYLAKISIVSRPRNPVLTLATQGVVHGPVVSQERRISGPTPDFQDPLVTHMHILEALDYFRALSYNRRSPPCKFFFFFLNTAMISFKISFKILTPQASGQEQPQALESDTGLDPSSVSDHHQLPNQVSVA